MDPIRYPDFVRDDLEGAEKTKKRLFSNIAERCAVEVFRLERLAQEFAYLRSDLEPFSMEMRKLMMRARDIERESTASTPVSRAILVGERKNEEDPNLLIGHALKSFGSIEFLFENPLPFATKNFHAREPGVGRWTGPGQVSTIEVELSDLIDSGLKTVDLVFSHSLAGPPTETVKAFVGKNLTPLPRDHIQWPNPMWMQVSVGGMEGCNGALTLMTKRTVKAPNPDTRFLGVALKSIGFSS